MSRNRRGWPLRASLAIVVAVVVVTAGTAGVYLRVQSTNDARQAAAVDAQFGAGVAASDMSLAINVLRTGADTLSRNPQVASIVAITGQCSLSFTGAGPFTIGHLDILRSDGSVACSSAFQTAAGGYGAELWLPNALAAASVVSPVRDVATGAESVIISAPIRGKGLVAIFLALEPVGRNLTARFGGSRHLEFLVTTADGKFAIARSINPAHWPGVALSQTPFALAGSAVERPDVQGTPRLYGQSLVPELGWNVYSGADAASALAAANTLQAEELVIILVGVLIVLLAAFLAYRWIADPIRLLRVDIRSATEQNYLHPVRVSGPVEVMAVSEEFNRLIRVVEHELAERQRGEAAARVSEANYRVLFAGHPHAMWIYDTETLAFLEVNDAAVDYLGYSREEFLKMNITQIRPPEDVPKFLELMPFPPVLDRSGPWRHLRKDGVILQALITSHQLIFDGHEARFLMAEDLSEAEMLERELHKAEARAEANAELNRAKDELISTVSHELRTPLASIVGFAELLATREYTHEAQAKYLDVMLSEGKRLRLLIDDFLGLQRIEGHRQTFDFAPVQLKALVMRAQAAAGDVTSVPITVDIELGLPLVMIDGMAILQVVTNLLSNARKYSPAGGAIEITARLVGERVEISIQDHGLGIPADAMPMLFEKFYRIDEIDRRDIKGTGLGLAIAQKIIEAHGGRIVAESAGLGKGSRFHFSLPVAAESAMTGDVLLVDDDGGLARVLQAELAAKGLSCVWASDAETAVDLLLDWAPKALVLDLVLPGAQGEQFLARLRSAKHMDLPVVVWTVRDPSSSEREALHALGVTHVMNKRGGAGVVAAAVVAEVLAGATARLRQAAG
jgi:PAS domain S-box-containing protein